MGASIRDTNWYHVAATKSGGTVVIYLEGVASLVQPFGLAFSFTSNLAIAIRTDLPVDDPIRTGRAFDGLIDEVEIFNHALGASEIQAIFDAGSAGRCKPPTIEELLQRIETLEDHTHTYQTGRGVGHNNTEAETGPAKDGE